MDADEKRFFITSEQKVADEETFHFIAVHCVVYELLNYLIIDYGCCQLITELCLDEESLECFHSISLSTIDKSAITRESFDKL